MISIIIVTYNNHDFLLPLLRSLKRALFNKYEIVIWDNRSSDGSYELCRLLLKKFDYLNWRVIRSPNNVGFAKGVNNVFKYCSGEDILLLNPDTELLKDSLKSLIKFYNKVKPAIVGGKYIPYDHDISIQRTAVNSLDFLSVIFELTNLKKIVPGQQLVNHFWKDNGTNNSTVCSVSGGFMICSKEIFNNLCGFDESYWLYLEDVDFCIRAKERGYQVFYHPKAKIKHYSGGSQKHLSRRHDENHWLHSRDIFFKRHYNLLFNLIYKSLSLLEYLILRLRVQCKI